MGKLDGKRPPENLLLNVRIILKLSLEKYDGWYGLHSSAL
jgi:hypothetical protein